MSGLVLKLAPYERLLINGAVIENGDRRTKISVKTANANILRLKDAVHPQEAQTPVSRICYYAQLLLSGDVGAEEGIPQLAERIDELDLVFSDPQSVIVLSEARDAIFSGNVYLGLRRLRQLLPLEQELLGREAS